MADSKITALTALTAADPANDMIPIVDVSDTPPASGNTKRISINNILACSPSATLASATISGDLTVDTSTLYVSSSTDKVGIGTTSLSGEKLTVAGNVSANAWVGRGNITVPSGDCSIFRSADNTLSFGIASTTAMTLNSTGLGVGVVPSPAWNAGGNIQVGTLGALYTNGTLGATDLAYNSIRTGTDTYQYLFGSSVAASRFQQRDGSFRFFTAPAGTSPNAITFTERLRLKETGQLRFMPLAADPSGAEAGDVYYNSSSNKLKCYNGTTWNDLF